MDPIFLIKDSGPIGLMILALGCAQGLVIVLAMVLSPFADLRAMVRMGNLSIAMLGVLGVLSGFVLSMEATARASAEMKQTMIAMGVSVGLSTATLAAMVLVPLLFFGALANSATATMINREQAQ